MSGGVCNKFTGYHNRRSIRLRGYDYSRPGAYFVTICIRDREQRLFGDVVGGKMALNDHGKNAEKCWLEIPVHFPDVKLDEFVVMPNHVHGIVIIRTLVVFADARDQKSVGVQNFEPLQIFDPPHGTQRNFNPLQPDSRHGYVLPATTNHENQYQHSIPRSIGSIVRGFKIGVTKWFREKLPDLIVWQRNFYDHIIRDEKSFYFIRHYIRDNPAQWHSDVENHLRKEVNQFHQENGTVLS